MNTFLRSLFRLAILGVGLGLAAVSSHAQMAQKPLLTSSSSVKPNIMIVQDNSGSMAWDYAPENYTDAFSGAIPQSTSTISSDANQVWYDPRTLYVPRVNAANVSLPKGTESTAGTISYDYNTPYSGWSSTTLTHYLCTTFNASNVCTAVKRYDVPSSSVATTYTWTAARTDCVTFPGVKCTWAEERQNVLNWNLYYSTRIAAITTAVGAALADPKYDNAFRLGYGWINDADGSTSSTVVQRGVRPFTDDSSLPSPYKTDKTNFYNFLYGISPNGSTPLYNAFKRVGNYFKDATVTGPWAADPVRGSDATAHLACRKSNFIILSDGGYNDSPSPSPGNIDGVANPSLNTGLVASSSSVHVNPTTGLTFTYSITPSKTATLVAYPDSDSNSLADMAMTYYLSDLRSDLSDLVPARTGRPAFWQNLVTYTIGFSVQTTNVSQASVTAYQKAFLNGTAMTLNWAPGGNPDPVDDFMHAAVNTTGQFYSVSSSGEVKNAINSILSDIQNQAGSDGGVAVADTNGSLSTLAGELKYVPTYNTIDSSGDVEAFTLDAAGNTASATPVWLMSRNIPTTGSRTLATISGTTVGTKLTTTFSTLPSDVKTALGAAANDNLMSYLFGTTAVTNTATGSLYRLRSSLIGPIVNSPPTYVRGELDMGYSGSSVTGAASYATYLANKANNRTGMLVVPANDGTVHVTDAITGIEKLGYMPRSAMPNLQAFATDPYTFQYILDGPAIEGDVYGTTTTSGWHNVVVGTGGRGGKFVYALEIPVPTSISGSPTSVTPTFSNLMWEINSSNTGMSNLGNVLQSPISGQTPDGTWVTIFGNGYYNATGVASLYIVNALTGALVTEISTGAGSVGTPNALGGVTLIRNANRLVVGALAGDKLGNLWKFVLSGATSASWGVAFGGKALFHSPSNQPFFGAPAWQPHPQGGIIVVGATGILIENADQTDTSTQTIYGIWDRSTIGGTATAAFMATLPLGTSTLVLQTSTSSVSTTTQSFTFYKVSTNSVNWGVNDGWMLNMNFQAGQRSISDVNNFGSSVVVASVVPPGNNAGVESCTSGTAQDYLYIIDALTGGNANSFDVNKDGTLDAYSVAYTASGFGRGNVIAKNTTAYRPEYNVNPAAPQPTCTGGAVSAVILGTASTSLAGGYACTSTSVFRRSWRQILNLPKMQ